MEPVCCSMSSSNCCFLTCIQVSQEAGQVVWYSHLLKNFPQFIMIHTVKGFGIVNKAEIDVFLELSCFFNDPCTQHTVDRRQGSQISMRMARGSVSWPSSHGRGLGPGDALMWMWFGALPGAFGLGRAQPQRRGTSPCAMSSIDQ